MSGEINYSLSVLIVLMLMFWFMCKCIGRNNEYYYQSQENMIDQNEFVYGDQKATIGNNSAYPYIRNRNNVIEVPNSKSAMRRLMSTEIYKCGLTNKIDNEPSTMYIKKKSKEKFINTPTSRTQERRFTPVIYRDMKPMPSY